MFESSAGTHQQQGRTYEFGNVRADPSEVTQVITKSDRKTLQAVLSYIVEGETELAAMKLTEFLERVQ